MPQAAPGLPDPTAYGDPTELQAGQLVPFFTQLHRARRAGEHEDIRLGNLKGQLLSWAARKGLPTEPGQKHLAIPQPLHEESYGPFSGTIPEGEYGAGEVESKIQGKALITHVDPTGVSFITAHERYPQRFRIQKTGKNWIIINTTPGIPRNYTKEHFKTLDASEVERLFTPKNLLTAKIDGSAEFLEILGDKVESLSYRTSKVTGRPIFHTERAGVKPLDEPIPGGQTVLRGELYGTRKGKAISAAELGGLLNSSIAKSLEQQKARGIEMRHGVFDILKHRGKDVSGLPYSERLELLKQTLTKMPAHYHLPEGYADPEKQRELWERIIAGKNPVTREGVVAHPLEDGVPTKVKPGLPERDVLIKEIVPGAGKYRGTHAGGFRYALPEQPDKIVGKVGQGISDEDRRDMWLNQSEWLGRTARVVPQEQFPSGAYRVPIFLGRHEDITQKEAAMKPRLIAMAAMLKQAATPAKMMAPSAGADKVKRFNNVFDAVHPPVRGAEDALQDMKRLQLVNRNTDRRIQVQEAEFAKWQQQQRQQQRQPVNTGVVDAPTPRSPVSPQMPEKVAAEVDDAAKQTDTKSTEGQKKAGNYEKGKVSWQGLPLSIENPAGSVRSGKSKAGRAWSVRMNHHYGYVLGSKGRDKEHVDVFVNPGTDDGFMVYIINQAKADGAFDEHKCMLGFGSKEDATRAYMSNFSAGWREPTSVVAMPLPVFKKWVMSDAPAKGEIKTTDVEEFKKMAGDSSWIGVDLDGSLAHYKKWKGTNQIGKPIEIMVQRVKRWLREGKQVKIFTARIDQNDPEVRAAIEHWSARHIGRILPVTCRKDRNCVRIWDDKAVGIKKNHGRQTKLVYAEKK